MRSPRTTFAAGGSVPSYVPDDLRNPKFDPAPVSAFFDTAIDGSSGRYLSEDYAFCRLVRNAGMHVWFCPWIRLTHMGSQLFIGDPGALQDIGAPATVDRSQL